MASSMRTVLVLLALSLLTNDTGVLGRAVDTRGLVSGSSGPVLRTDALRRWRRGVVETHAETHAERCAELAAPWQENGLRAPEANATVLQLRVRPFNTRAPQGPVFPGKSLFGFVRRVYRCCREGLSCRRVKGIQGRMRGDTDVEFLLTGEMLALPVTRAELHLQLSNPQHLDVRPVLSSLAKLDLPTRYSLWSGGNVVELRVDLLLLLQSLQEAAGGPRGGPSLLNMRRVALSSRGDLSGQRPPPGAPQGADGAARGEGGPASRPPGLELGLVLGCSQAGSGASCASVGLSHSPFVALYYR